LIYIYVIYFTDLHSNLSHKILTINKHSEPFNFGTVGEKRMKMRAAVHCKGKQYSGTVLNLCAIYFNLFPYMLLSGSDNFKPNSWTWISTEHCL